MNSINSRTVRELNRVLEFASCRAFEDCFPLQEYFFLSRTTRFLYRRSASAQAASLRCLGACMTSFILSSFSINSRIIHELNRGYLRWGAIRDTKGPPRWRPALGSQTGASREFSTRFGTSCVPDALRFELSACFTSFNSIANISPLVNRLLLSSNK